MEKSCSFFAGDLSPEEAESRMVQELCWKAAPHARSEAALCEIIAAAMPSRRGKPVHPRTVKNWVRGHNTPRMIYMLALFSMAGAESVFAFLSPEDRL